MGALLEHFAGALPLWLAPTQCVIIPVSEKASPYAATIADALKSAEVRVSVDFRNERLQKKIRDAEMEKIPYMVVVGEKEAQDRTVSVRSKSQGDMGKKSIEEFMQMISREIQEKVR